MISRFVICSYKNKALYEKIFGYFFFFFRKIISFPIVSPIITSCMSIAREIKMERIKHSVHISHN